MSILQSLLKRILVEEGSESLEELEDIEDRKETVFSGHSREAVNMNFQCELEMGKTINYQIPSP